MEHCASWLARLPRRNYTSFSDDFTNAILLSECATLKHLERIQVPAPRLHGYGLQNDIGNNAVGVAYMLIDELPGHALNIYGATEAQKLKVYEQLASINRTISLHPFESIGSLTLGPRGDIQMGPVTGDRTGTLSQIGPFCSARDYYSAWCEEYLERIADYQLFSTYPVNAYLVFKYLAQMASEGRWNPADKESHLGPFYLKHMDDKGDHIMVDDDFNITGIIDWTFARVVLAYEAFGPSLVTANTSDLFSGTPGLTAHDKALADAMAAQGVKHATVMRSVDTVRRFSFALGMGMSFSWNEALKLFEAILRTSGDYEPAFQWHEWRQRHLAVWAGDKRLAKLLSENPEPSISETLSPPDGYIRGNIAVPRFATCSFHGCNRPTVRGSKCSQCLKAPCAYHKATEPHACPSLLELDDAAWTKLVDDEVVDLLSQLDRDEFVRIASSLNGGKACAFTPGKHIGVGATMGCANYHAWITFDDGEKWLVRIPRTTGANDVPAEIVEYLVASEYATLKFLESISVPAPRAYGYGVASDPFSKTGVSYILMEALPGTPYYQQRATKEQNRHVLKQVADILIELSRHPLQNAGSLILHHGRIVVSDVASDRFLSLGLHGPYATSKQYWSQTAEEHLRLVADGQICSDFPKEAFLFYNLLKVDGATALSAQGEGFFLKHVDDKGDHLLVDEDFNITGIIDWQFARVVPAREAFGPSLVSADLAQLHSRHSGLSDGDRIVASRLRSRGFDELAHLAGGDELARRFHLGLRGARSRDEARELVAGMLGALYGTEDRDVEAWMAEE